jgi:hypothetical protein
MDSDNIAWGSNYSWPFVIFKDILPKELIKCLLVYILLWDWEPDALEGTCWHDKDVSDFLKGQALSYFEYHLRRTFETEDSELPDNDLIEIVLRDIALRNILCALYVCESIIWGCQGAYVGI